MQVSVVVPTWRRPEDLARCLDGLEAQRTPPAEVLVTVRSDDEATRVALARGVSPGLPLRPIWVDRAGVSASLNLGLEAATGDVVAITDDDALPWPDWLERLTAYFERDQRLGAVGGRDYVREDGALLDDARETVGRVHWYGRVVGNHHLGVGDARHVELLKGVNMAFRKTALRGIRVDETLRGSGMQMHWEMGLCLAVRRAGWTLLYDPAVGVDHYPAPRPDGHARHGLSPDALSNETYNETYSLARWLPLPRVLPALAYGLLVGTRRAPGALTALERLARGGRRPGDLRIAMAARWQAIRAGVRARGRAGG